MGDMAFKNDVADDVADDVAFKNYVADDMAPVWPPRLAPVWHPRPAPVGHPVRHPRFEPWIWSAFNF
jgi:hypothetical protein